MFSKTLAAAILLVSPAVAMGQYASYAKNVRIADSAAAIARRTFEQMADATIAGASRGAYPDFVALGADCRKVRDTVKRLADKFDVQPVPANLSRVHAQLIERLRGISASADTASAAALAMTCFGAAPGSGCNIVERQANFSMVFAHASIGIDAGVRDYLVTRGLLTELLLEHRVKLTPAEVPTER